MMLHMWRYFSACSENMLLQFSFQRFSTVKYVLHDILTLRIQFQGVPVLVPGLCLPKALQPFLPIFQQVSTRGELLVVL